MAIEFSRSVDQIEADSKAIEAAIQAAVRDALIEHKRLGQPIVIADENENVVWVPANEIEIPDLQDRSNVNAAIDNPPKP